MRTTCALAIPDSFLWDLVHTRFQVIPCSVSPQFRATTGLKLFSSLFDKTMPGNSAPSAWQPSSAFAYFAFFAVHSARDNHPPDSRRGFHFTLNIPPPVFGPIMRPPPIPPPGIAPVPIPRIMLEASFPSAYSVSSAFIFSKMLWKGICASRR